MGKEDLILIKNVRASYPHLWKEEEKNGNVYPRSVNLVLSKKENLEVLKKLKARVEEVKKGTKGMESALTRDPSRVCLKPADPEALGDQYAEGMFSLKANVQKNQKVYVLHQNGQRCEDEEQDRIYAGCRVNAKVDIWPQDNAHGKRINCKLVAIQFAGDDKPFDESVVTEDVALDGFEAIDDLGGGGADPLADDDW
jgi:hypothetical protein